MNLIWFRRDLRVSDNPALFNACAEKKGVIGIHITTPKTWVSHHMGEPQQQWLVENLNDLEKELASLNIPLLRVQTNYFSECPKLLLELARKHAVDELYYNLEYEWDERRRDALTVKLFSKEGINVKCFHDQCLNHPETIKTQQHKPYSVFTPYKKGLYCSFRERTR